MASRDEQEPLNLESAGTDLEQERLRQAADTDTVVRGANGGLAPKAQRLRPLAGLIVIAIVVLAAIYMRHGLASRNHKAAAQTETAKAGVGPATTVERGLLSDQARNGLDTGQSHVPESLVPRPSIMSIGNPAPASGSQAGGNAASPSFSAVPPIEYRPNPVSTAVNGSLSFAEERRLEEYKREREAIESPTSVGGTLPSLQTSKTTQVNDPIQAIQSALINARLAQAPGSTAPSAALQNGSPAQEQRTEYERQNDQDQRTGFGLPTGKPEADYFGNTRKAAEGKYEVKAGWLIPAVLKQQLDSDLPGMIRALVRENVYDTSTGESIVIPAGSTLVGIYNSHVGYGQKALQAVWRRLIFPDGSSIALGGFEGDDEEGATGFRDQVDNHWTRIFSGALLTSLFAAGIEISQGSNSSLLTQPSLTQQVGQAVGQQVGQVGVEVTRRNLNVQPTIKVRPGYRFFVRVEKDLLFKGPYSPMRPGG